MCGVMPAATATATCSAEARRRASRDYKRMAKVAGGKDKAA